MRRLLKRLSYKLLSAALLSALLIRPALAAAQPTVPPGWQSSFSDVPQGAWFYPFVAVLNSRGIVSGYGDGRFGPNDPTRAGDSIIMILKAAGCDTLATAPGAHYAAAYADYAVNQSYLTAQQLPADLDGAISRLFIARLAALALGLPAAQDPSPFADTDDGYATTLHQRGILSGHRQGDALLFSPDSPITRSELCAIAWQVQEYTTHIHFGAYDLDILPGVPVNPFDPSAFVPDGDRMRYQGDGVQTSLGIDVSFHQGSINWTQVANDGIEFAMIRAGGRYYGIHSGTLFEDTAFHANIRGALDAGLEVGVYFFSQAITVQEAIDEAQFLLALVKDYSFTGPVVFDWENISSGPARTDGIDAATVTAMANAFCDTVEQAGYQPMIYFNQYIAYLLYDLEGVAQYPFWLAQYGQIPDFYYGFVLWQYTDQGQVNGIQGPVDMNLRLLPQQAETT